jgi:ATP-dependent exoDNAse (exonuclease V) alpha subunit
MTKNINSADLLAKLRANVAAKKAAQEALNNPIIPEQSLVTAIKEELETASEIATTSLYSTDKYGNTITYNAEQADFVRIAKERDSCVLVGAAGTGKTTAMRGVMDALIRDVGVPVLKDCHHKHLIDGTPGIIAVSYTRRAVQNLKRAMSEDMQYNCITIHKLLEFAPTYFEVMDETTGMMKKKMEFLPMRNRTNPLPRGISTIIIDESSMVSGDGTTALEQKLLHNYLLDALSHSVQIIYLGDIQQLPPVFGCAILGYKLIELPVIELTQVYRQALESPIIRLAHRILSGIPILPAELEDWYFPGQLKLHPWKKSIHSEAALHTTVKFLTMEIERGLYIPEEDMVLCPWGKESKTETIFGTKELNKGIGNYLARRDDKYTYEIIAGFAKHYMSVGDKVLYEKEDAIITSIEPNGTYTGKAYRTASKSLDYWGFEHDTASANQHESSNKKLLSLDDTLDDDDALDAYMAMAAGDDDSRTREASHVITMKLIDSDILVSVSSAAEVNELLFAWALTVHKSQGSEFRKVYITLHKVHNVSIFRELLYTAVTRAREELYVICEPDHFVKGINSQRIKGNTLAEKAEFFKGKKAELKKGNKQRSLFATTEDDD